ncbi:MAG: DUF1073 domain-containing protein [Rhodospirillales bacterium]|nr:DUF1073 domain-containing protein [Rhodospirillales bacterium]
MFNLFRRQPEPMPKPARKPALQMGGKPGVRVDEFLQNLARVQPYRVAPGAAMDDSNNGMPLFKSYLASINTASEALLGWYTSQSFIGHQLAGILAQHWLINKACAMPGSDALRKGYSIVGVDGEELDPESTKMLQRYDRAFRINWHMREFIRKGRIFGVRIAMFKVESTDPAYYEKPFNIDGVTPNSYKGIVQVDPYWTAPLLDQAGSGQPDSMHFYDPTWWLINGRKIHRSHLIVFRHDEPIDVLKPVYLYGGIPLPQQIMERVYAAEATANEAPQLAKTKRTSIWMTDTTAGATDLATLQQRAAAFAAFRDNYAIQVGDKESEDFNQFDTSLTDFDALIMTQYQLVAAQSGVPATKLLGTQPKGFNASGDYEESVYHELLESIQENDLTPFLERHHALVMRSFVAPGGLSDVRTTVSWNPLDTPTAKELADTNLVKAQAGSALIASGAISSEDERARLATDKTSGYQHIDLSETPDPIDLDDDDEE